MATTTPRPWLASYAEGVPHDVEAQQGSLVPKRVVPADDLPRSLIGKVLRREVRSSLLTD